MKIYVASSWRNEHQPEVVARLRQAGHEVYDFRNPAEGNNGFGWRQIDDNWQGWSPEKFKAALSHPVAIEGFRFDFDAMKWAEACVMVLPCGRSASLEAGWFVGAGRPLYILLAEGEPELMFKLAEDGAGGIFTSLEDVIAAMAEEAAKT